MKTILVATDYSASAEVAIRYATFIAGYTNAQVALLNIYTFNIHALNGRISPSAMDDLVRKNQNHLEKYASQLSTKYGMDLSAYTLNSIFDDSLEELIQKLEAGLLLIGMKTELNSEHSSGNTANALLSQSNLPVLVVPECTEFKLPEKVLYACDYHALPNKEHLNGLKEIASSFGAEVQVFHVWKSPVVAELEENAKKSVINKLETVFGDVEHSYKDIDAKDILEGLRKGIKDFNADILVMSPHRYGFWNSLFHKSKTREMLIKCTIPFLSIPS